MTKTVCYFEEKCDYNACWPVKRNDVEIGKVYGDSKDSVDTVKLRIQDQLCIPVSCISVSRVQQKGRPFEYFVVLVPKS